ncbi:MAG: hypothetical protein KAJ03_05095 [Gammaproteobacteria bacterium]|nr:hypothetical protein [Gammaproteobacteria bacterium]
MKVDKEKMWKNKNEILAAGILACCGVFLLLTAAGMGPLYEVIKPQQEDRLYLLVGQHVDDGELVFDVIPVDEGYTVAGEQTEIVVPNNNKLLDRFIGESVIQVSYAVQITGEADIIGLSLVYIADEFDGVLNY